MQVSHAAAGCCFRCDGTHSHEPRRSPFQFAVVPNRSFSRSSAFLVYFPTVKLARSHPAHDSKECLPEDHGLDSVPSGMMA